MKVLMLGWELPPYNSGGLGVACYQLCQALSKNDVVIDFVVPYQHDEPVSFMTVKSALPHKVARFSGGFAYDSQLYAETADGETIDLYQQQKMYEHSIDDLTYSETYDVIHAHDWLTFRAALKAKMTLDCPLIVHVHSVERDRAGGNDGNPLVREIESIGMLLADRVIAVSEHTKQCIMRDYDIPADKIEVVHNSIDTDVFQPLDASNAYQYITHMKQLGYRVVVSIGRLTIQKNLRNLLYAAKEVVQRNPKTLFLIVGSGEQYFELITLAAELGIARNVIFTGFQRGKNWRDAYAVGDVFVMPSVSEPFGLTPLEAISYGTPSVISRQSGVSEVMRNCIKVDHWDVHELANSITALVQHDGLRQELRDQSYAEFTRLSWDDSASKLRDIYKQHAGVAV
jgi:glycogen synthase